VPTWQGEQERLSMSKYVPSGQGTKNGKRYFELFYFLQFNLLLIQSYRAIQEPVSFYFENIDRF
jgi:hypothetical protein